MIASNPSIDFTRFQWRPSPTDPALHIREASGSEVIHDAWNKLYSGQQLLFFGVELALRTHVPTSEFIKHARAAWSALRLEIPTVASQVSVDDGGFVFMTYRAASSHDDVDAWVQRTVRLNLGTIPQSLDDLRYTLGTRPIPEHNGDQTFLYVLPRQNDREFGLLIHTSHTPFDGGGIKILMNRFLARLADSLTGHPAHPRLPCGGEVKNLLPSITEAISPEEPLSGQKYEETLSEILGDMNSALPVRTFSFN